MSSSPTQGLTLKIPKTPRRGFPSERTRSFQDGETIVMAPDYKRFLLQRITANLEREDLTQEERLYWDSRFLDVWKAPTQPPE